MKTMDEVYGDNSNHKCCEACGFCLDCRDCTCDSQTSEEVKKEVKKRTKPSKDYIKGKEAIKRLRLRN